MPLYEIKEEELRRVSETTYQHLGLKERQDLQRLLKANIEIIAPGTLLIAEEFGQFEGSARRIDLLCLDGEANLVVIELKRTEDGGHMDLQAVRYAAMVSTMTFDHVVEAYADQLDSRGEEAEDQAREKILEFLKWEMPDESRFAQQTRIVLASADFSKEITTAVLWLNEQGLDIRCVRMKPYESDGKVLVEVSQVVPLPEAEDFVVRTQAKRKKERLATEEWTEDAFFADLSSRVSEEEVCVARDLLSWSNRNSNEVRWGAGKHRGTFAPWLNLGPGIAYSFQIFLVRSDGTLISRADHLEKKLRELGDVSALTKYRAALNSIPTVEISDSVKRPRIPLSRLTGESTTLFLAVAEEFMRDLRTSVSHPEKWDGVAPDPPE